MWAWNSDDLNLESGMSKIIYAKDVVCQSGVFHITLTSLNEFLSETQYGVFNLLLSLGHYSHQYIFEKYSFHLVSVMY